ncbi:MAG: hypothetical protein GY711_14705 [bacterium]|nr:hypothetical protein [bacterium]
MRSRQTVPWRLCLSGNIGRFHRTDQIIQGPEGTLDVDRDALPVNPVQAVMPGDTWNFQCWFRDGTTNNFTDGVGVTFN